MNFSCATQNSTFKIILETFYVAKITSSTSLHNTLNTIKHFKVARYILKSKT